MPCRLLYDECPNGVWKPSLMAAALRLMDQRLKCNFGTLDLVKFGDDFGAIIRIACVQIRQLVLNNHSVQDRVFAEVIILNLLISNSCTDFKIITTHFKLELILFLLFTGASSRYGSSAARDGKVHSR